jgi:hypothetical protein
MDLWVSWRIISLFGTLLKQITLLLTASLASWSASSLPLFPAWAFIHVNTIFHFSLSRVAVFFPISSIRFFLFFGFLRDSKIILLSVWILTVRGTLWLRGVESVVVVPPEWPGCASRCCFYPVPRQILLLPNTLPWYNFVLSLLCLLFLCLPPRPCMSVNLYPLVLWHSLCPLFLRVPF